MISNYNFTNDLLNLILLETNNIKSISYVPKAEPEITPLNNPDLKIYKSYLDTIHDYLNYFSKLEKKLENGEFEKNSQIIEFYIIRHKQKSFFDHLDDYNNSILYSDNPKLFSKLNSKYFNEEALEYLLDCNDFVSKIDKRKIYLAPYKMAHWYKKNKIENKYMDLINEALNYAIAMEDEEIDIYFGDK
ncbi:hypothetical protein TCON_0209 [Astathelohania contejeani]|uniref:Uncharacterized protein n=1 Tax=Astathelohania contejeani TaxID=164912 RepID=A0ABQ7I2J4_9MICR|nr:hypothetical protein TCON_0209 [Thelohania contejeani]